MPNVFAKQKRKKTEESRKLNRLNRLILQQIRETIVFSYYYNLVFNQKNLLYLVNIKITYRGNYANHHFTS